MLSDTQRSALALRLRRDRDSEPEVIPRRPAGAVDLPLSCGQEQLWFIDRFVPGRPIYNIPVVLRLTGPLDTAALRQALAGLLTRHEALRTRLRAGDGGQPVQVIDPPAPVPLAQASLPGGGPGKQRQRLRALIERAAMEPFDLAKGPLLRVTLLRLAGAEHVLLLVVHHTVFDGWSARVLLAELAALYRAAVTGKPPGLAELPVQFADYALWERERLRGPALAGLVEYWRAALAGQETVEFPTDRPRPAVAESAGGLAEHQTSPALLAGLRELSRREGTTLFVTLLAALLALLHRWTGQTDLTVGTFSANRGRAELAPLIGFLVTTLPVRADVSGDPSFRELLARVKAAAVGAFAHQDLPFGKLVEALGGARDASRAPVFQIALSFAERDDAPVAAAGVEFAPAGLVAGINAAKFDLDFLAEARPGGLWFECSYATALFDASTVRRLLGNLEVLLRGAAADPSAPLSRLPVLTGEERHAELVTWNDTAASRPVSSVHTEFEAQAARTPDVVAAQFEDERWTYRELNQWANRIARRLRRLGVGPEVLTGVCMATGLRRLAALLAIWKAGGGYVPLDPALPPARLAFLRADARLAVVLTDGPAVVPVGGAAVVSLDDEWQAISQLPGTNLTLRDPAGPGNVAYMIYTSGSTGQPKGVMVEHRQAVSFLHTMTRFCEIGGDDVGLQFASLSFDASVHETFMPLLAGARLLLVPPQARHSPPRLAALMRAAGVTFAFFTPSVASLLSGERLPSLRMLMVGGEEFPSGLVRRWLRPGLRLVNDYGPTEGTVTAAVAELGPGTRLPPPIGRPIANCQAYVLDPRLNPVPAGVAGELHIGGAGVARGYLNRPGLTARRFIPDPFGGAAGARLYKTGDLVRRLADGSLVYLGRIDNQVKVRGLRIELGEIEAALTTHPAVAEAAAAVVAGPAGERQLAGYFRAAPGGAEPDPGELRAHLGRVLPGALVPTHLVSVASFPLTSSGKVDRAALPPPPASLLTAAAPEAPASYTESVLVELFGQVLGRGPAGAADSFFDLGGSSLQVMRLLDRIYHELAVDVGVTAVFLHPSPRQLAAHIDAIRSGTAAGRGGDGPLVELSDGPGELPLYLIHPIGGTVTCYAQLAGELAGTCKVHGLQAPALAAGQTAADATASSMAGLVADYARLIRTAQPAGPYRLAGWSMGGVVAFEIARRLERAGERVALLALLDAPFALPGPGRLTEPQLAGQFLADAAQSLGWDAGQAPDPATSSTAGQLAWLAGRLGGATERPGSGTAAGGGAAAGAPDGVAALLRRRFEVFGAHSRLLAGYQPAGGRAAAATLIVSAARSLNAPARACWPSVLRGPVSTVVVDGDHYTFLRPPLVADVGTAILKWQAEPQ
jgi:amino acid adenylation domain-containing protein